MAKKMTSDDVINATAAAFDEIKSKYLDVLANLKTDAQRNEWRDAYIAADTAQWKAINAVFQADDGFLRQLVMDLSDETTALTAALADLKKVVAILNAAAQVAKTALAITALAA